MLLHRYLGSYAFETLKEAKLKTARLSSFNDPFEFLFRTIGEMTAKKAREYIDSRRNDLAFLNLAAQHIPGLFVDKKANKVLERKLPQMRAWIVANSERLRQMPIENRERISDKTLRVICFSEAMVDLLDEIVLWSHYAQKHIGVRIGFEFPSEKKRFEIFKVDYRESQLEVDISTGITDGTLGNVLFECAKTKSLAWRYEHEHRLLTTPKYCEPKIMPDGTTEHFLDFSRAWVKSVDFGVRCPQAEIQRITTLLKADYPHVVFRKADYHKSEYALEYKEI